MDHEVRRNEERGRYELVLDGEVVGIADFVMDGDTIVLPHTVIDPDRRGQGLGDLLVEGVLADARERGTPSTRSAGSSGSTSSGIPKLREHRDRGPCSRTGDECDDGSHNPTKEHDVSDRRETAILAGGCFWGMQDLIRKRPGVISTRVGYTGDDNLANATYRNHGTHAEAIEIVFDPEQTSFRDLLEFFFQIHDPTTMNRQGNDVGASYRSAIFYTSDDQKRVAEDTIADVEASGLWPGKVVTEVTAAGPFWEAEPEHQDYLERIPNGYTCHFPRPGWKLPHRADAS